MADYERKRILNFDEETGALDDDDFLLLDSPTNGTRKIKANSLSNIFIDTDNVIKSMTEFKTSTEYTATEDCYIVFYVIPTSNNTVIRLNNVIVGNFDGSGNYGITHNFYVKKGQIISVERSSSQYYSYYIVYGLQHGTD